MRTLANCFPLALLCGSLFGQPYNTSVFAGYDGMPTDRLAPALSIGGPSAIAADASGNVYIATGCTIFRVDSSGRLTRLAGGLWCTSGVTEGGSALDARFYSTAGVAVDNAGNVYIAATQANKIYKVSNGIITRFAGGSYGYSGDNGPALNATFKGPQGLALDSAGNLYVADAGNNVIRKISDGAITTIAGNGQKGSSGDGGPATSASLNLAPNSSALAGVAVDSAGAVYIADYGNNSIRKVSGGNITKIGSAYSPMGVAVDSAGNVYFPDYILGRIYKLTNGATTTFAGGGGQGSVSFSGPATSALLPGIKAVAVDPAGNVYIGDAPNSAVRKVSQGSISTIAGNGFGDHSGDNGPASTAQLSSVSDVAVDKDGSVYVAEYGSHMVRKITNGVITTIAGNGYEPWWEGNFGGDNGPATSAMLSRPSGLAFDAAGNFYISDTANCRIRKVAKGIITTIAGNGKSEYSGDGGPATSAGLMVPKKLAVDAAGNLYIADQGRVRKVTPAGVISTFVGDGTYGYSGDGGPASAAKLNTPAGLAVDAAGNLYIADRDNYRIRKVTPAGVISTFAGAGTRGYSGGSLGEGGPAVSFQFQGPSSVAVDSAGNLFVVDLSGVYKISNGIINRIGAITANYPDNKPSGIAVNSAGAVYAGEALTMAYGVAVLYPVWLSSQATQLNSAGGPGTVLVSTPGGSTWTASTDASWITITGGFSGSGSGSVTYMLQANTGAARSGSITVAGQTFRITQEGATAGLNLIGSMAHLASAGGWDTSLRVVNLGATGAQVQLNFRADDGSAQSFRVASPPMQSSPSTAIASAFATAVDQTIPAGGMLEVDTSGAAGQPVASGWSQLLTGGSVDGFAVFDYRPTGQEAVVPLETRNAASYLLAFDNTGSIATGLAIANLAASAANVGVVIRNDAGAQIGTGTINIPAKGHTSFMLTDAASGFPATAAKRGTVEFVTPQGGRISALGLRASGAAITTLPVLANVGVAGGTMAHIACGAGWQTVFTLVNTGAASANATLNFFSDAGVPLALPLRFTGAMVTSTSVTQTIPAGGTWIIATQGQDAGATVSGLAELTTTGNISGFAIFQNAGQEAVTPLETRAATTYTMPFDNSNGLTTGIALANRSASSATVQVSAYFESGTFMTSASIVLPAHGHSAQMLPTWMPGTARYRGTLRLTIPAGAQIGVLGIRATPAGAYTSIPVLAK